MTLTPPGSELLLLPLTEALARSAGRDVRVRVLAPPYLCAGVGTLRVLRVSASTEAPESAVLDVAYESYARMRARVP